MPDADDCRKYFHSASKRHLRGQEVISNRLFSFKAARECLHIEMHIIDRFRCPENVRDRSASDGPSLPLDLGSMTSTSTFEQIAYIVSLLYSAIVIEFRVVRFQREIMIDST